MLKLSKRVVKLVLVPVLCSGWGVIDADVPTEGLSAFRIRADAEGSLNTDTDWMGGLNEGTPVMVDQPFRLRVQVTSEPGKDALRFYLLQYKLNEATWQTALPADFPYPAYASPPVSIVAPAYAAGAPSEDLIPQSADYEHSADSAGVGFSPVSPIVGETGVAVELEWTLVVRYFADGPIRILNGDRIEFRLARLDGNVLESRAQPEVRVIVPPFHLGGTYVESPGKIGPWQTAAGELFFIMEPTETDNRFMMVISPDGGRTWREIDGANRPLARDLEAVDAEFLNGTIHILHQEDRVWYHAFETSDARSTGSGWKTRSEPVASPGKPPVQSVGISARADGSVAGFFADGNDIHIKVRDSAGSWATVARLSEGLRLSGIQVSTRKSGTAVLVYTREDGMGVAREFTSDNQLGPAIVVSKKLGTSESDVGSILCPVILEESGQTVYVFRARDGRLYERHSRSTSGGLSDPVQISPHTVVQNAVDSDQVAADVVAVGGELLVFYIEEKSRDLYLTRSADLRNWSPPELLVEGIDGSWIRAQVLQDGAVGYIYDAGSKGGSGMNKFGLLRAD